MGILEKARANLPQKPVKQKKAPAAAAAAPASSSSKSSTKTVSPCDSEEEPSKPVQMRGGGGGQKARPKSGVGKKVRAQKQHVFSKGWNTQTVHPCCVHKGLTIISFILIISDQMEKGMTSPIHALIFLRVK